MAKDSLTDWDETAANNTDVGGVNLAEGMLPSDVNNAIREMMEQVAKFIGADTIASASTTDLSTVPGHYVEVTGTTTITALGTLKAGTVKFLKFVGALTLTHNATSLILPGAANIAVAAGDTAIVVSEGSGNWRCLDYQRATGRALISTWEHIETRSITAATAEAFVDQSPYAIVRMTGYLAPSVSGATLRIRTSSDNGVSFDSGASDYTFQYDRGAGSTADAGFQTTDSGLLTPFTVGNTTGYLAAFTTMIYAFNKSNLFPAIITNAGSIDPSATRGVGDVFTSRSSLTARNAFQVFPSSGTMTGLIILEGIRG